MKRILIILLSFCFLAGCSSFQPVHPDDKLLVYASFHLAADFTEKIGGDKVKVVNLMPGTADPHDWEPTPLDMRGLSQADVFVYNGAGLEGWADKVLLSLDNPQLVVIKSTANIPLLENQAEDEHDHVNEHGHSEHEEHDHGAFDPHTWLSPINAKKEMLEIKNGLAGADPKNARYYEDNYNYWAEELDKLDLSFKTALKDIPSRNIVVAHGAYGYLCHEYDLHQLPIEGFSSEVEPSPKKMAEVIDFVRDQNISAVFFDPSGSPDVPQAIQRDTGVNIAHLSSGEIIPPGQDYFDIMQGNLNTLTNTLAR